MPGSSVVREDQRFFFVKPSVPNGNIHAYPGTRAIVASSWEWLLERILRREILLSMVGRNGEAARRAIASREARYALVRPSRYRYWYRADGDGVYATGTTRTVALAAEPALASHVVSLPDGSLHYNGSTGAAEYGVSNVRVNFSWRDIMSKTVGLCRRPEFCVPESAVPSVSVDGTSVVTSTLRESHVFAEDGGQTSGSFVVRTSVGVVPLPTSVLPMVRMVGSHRVFDRPRRFSFPLWDDANARHEDVGLEVFPVPDPRPFDAVDAAEYGGGSVPDGRVTVELPGSEYRCWPARTVDVVADGRLGVLDSLTASADVYPGVPACLAPASMSPVEVRWTYGSGYAPGQCPATHAGDYSPSETGHLFADMPYQWPQLAGCVTSAPIPSRTSGLVAAGDPYGSGLGGTHSHDSQVSEFGLWCRLRPIPDWNGRPTYWASVGFPHVDGCACGRKAVAQLKALGHVQPSLPSAAVPVRFRQDGNLHYVPAATLLSEGGESPPVATAPADPSSSAGRLGAHLCGMAPAEASRYLDRLVVTLHRVSLAYAVDRRFAEDYELESVTRDRWDYGEGDEGSATTRMTSREGTVSRVRAAVASADHPFLYTSAADMFSVQYDGSPVRRYSHLYVRSNDGERSSHETRSRTVRQASCECRASRVVVVGSVSRPPGDPVASGWEGSYSETSSSRTVDDDGTVSSSSSSDEGADGPGIEGSEVGPSESMFAGVAKWISSAEAFVVMESEGRTRKTVGSDATAQSGSSSSRTVSGSGTDVTVRRVVAASLGRVDPATGRIPDVDSSGLLSRLLPVPETGTDESSTTARSPSGTSTESSRTDRTAAVYGEGGSSSTSILQPRVYVMVAWNFDTENPPSAGAPDGLSAVLEDAIGILSSARATVVAVVARVSSIRSACSGLRSTLAGYRSELEGQAPSVALDELDGEVAEAEAALAEAEAALAEAEAALAEAEARVSAAVAAEAEAREAADRLLEDGDLASYDAARVALGSLSADLSSAVAARSAAQAARDEAQAARDDAQSRLDGLDELVRAAEEAQGASEQAAADAIADAEDAVDAAEAPLDAVDARCSGDPEDPEDGGLLADIDDALGRCRAFDRSSGDEAGRMAAARALLAEAKALEESASDAESEVAVDDAGPTPLSEARTAVRDARIALVSWRASLVQGGASS